MARPERPERNRTARSFHQLRRFHRVINSDKVFGTHSGYDIHCQGSSKKLNWVRCLTTKRQKPWAKRSTPPVRTWMKPATEHCLLRSREMHHRSGKIGRT